MSELIKKRLGDIVNFKRGYDLPASQRKEGIYPVISSSGISGFHSEYKCDGQGIVTGRYGTLGKMYYINGKYWPHNTTLYVTEFNSNDPKYVYYLLQCLGNLKTADKSTVPGINRNDLHEITIPFAPKVKNQKPIAKVLSDLDAKIALNTRINAELEKMAKTLYDYWFVQFDFPNEEGKPYKSSGGKMVFSPELGREIPWGWEVKELSSIFDLNPTSSLKKGSESSYIDMNAIPEKGFMTKAVQKKEFNGGVKFKNGDVVVGRITPCLENGKTGLITLLEEGDTGFGSTEFIVLRGKNKPLSSFAAYTARSELFRKYAIANMTGTSGRKRVEAKLLALFKLPIPDNNLLQKFEKTVGAFFEKETLNTKENHHLTQLRDWLLPMLMNGQVRVE